MCVCGCAYDAPWPLLLPLLPGGELPNEDGLLARKGLQPATGAAC